MSSESETSSSRAPQKLDYAGQKPGREVDAQRPVPWWCNLWLAAAFGAVGYWLFPFEPPRSRWALCVSIGCVFISLMMVGLQLLRLQYQQEPQYHARPSIRGGRRGVSESDASGPADKESGQGV